MKPLKWLTIIGCCLGISGCVIRDSSLAYPEVEPHEVVWINGTPYYYSSPGLYYRVYIQDGNYRYLGAHPHVGGYHHTPYSFHHYRRR